MSDCPDCPHVRGGSTERDCCFPDCVGGWERAYLKLSQQLTTAEEEIQRLTALVPEWVSVEDRLPEISDFRPISSAYKRGPQNEVLVLTESGEVHITIYTGLGWANYFDVTHWMPINALPPSPKQDKE